MRKIFLAFFFLVALALVACGGSSEPTAAPERQRVDDEQPAAGPEASGRPQLVEFYADW